MTDEPHQLTPEHVAAIDAAVRATSPAQAPSGIFYHPMFHTLDGGRFISDAAVEVALADFRQIVWELSRSALHADPLADLDALDEATAAAIRERVVPMAVLDCRFEAVTERAMRRFVATIAGGGELDLAAIDRAGLLETRRVSLCRPLVESVPDGERVTFSFDAGWQVANSGEQPIEIVFDPGDGKGPRNVAPGAQVEAGYDSTGDKTLTITLKFAEGRETTTVASLRVRALSLPRPSWEIKLVSGNHRGEVATGSMRGYYAPGRGRMMKPLFMWTGFKTRPTLGGRALVEHWAATADDYLADPDILKLLEECRQARWDVVIIEFHDTKKSIQANAAMVREAIKQVNVMCRAPREPGAILTGSMGGLVARYALLQREDPVQHIARAIFFDSPFKGAVIPMSVQYAIDFFAFVSTEAAQRREEYLNAPSAKQMLVQVFDTHWTQQDHPQPDASFRALDNEFAALGHWPPATDCYVATSGSGERRGQLKDNGTTLAPEDLMIYCDRWDALVVWKANAWLHAAPDAVQRRSSKFKSTAVGHPPGRHWEAWVSQTPPWDSCPGGFYDSVGQFARGYEWTKLDLRATNSCFIPTLSAINIDPAPDPYRAPPSVTPKPFKDVYMPAANTYHCQLTPEVATWIKKILFAPSD